MRFLEYFSSLPETRDALHAVVLDSESRLHAKMLSRRQLQGSIPANGVYQGAYEEAIYAASVLVQGLTAWHGLVELGGAKEGSRVLVHSAAGGVGCAALEICKNLARLHRSNFGKNEGVRHNAW